jgi:hypothetical protein
MTLLPVMECRVTLPGPPCLAASPLALDSSFAVRVVPKHISALQSAGAHLHAGSRGQLCHEGLQRLSWATGPAAYPSDHENEGPDRPQRAGRARGIGARRRTSPWGGPGARPRLFHAQGQALLQGQVRQLHYHCLHRPCTPIRPFAPHARVIAAGAHLAHVRGVQ